MPQTNLSHPVTNQNKTTLIWAWTSIGIAAIVVAGVVAVVYLFSNRAVSPTPVPPIVDRVPNDTIPPSRPEDTISTINQVQPRRPNQLNKLVYVRYANPDQAGGDIDVFTSAGVENGKVSDERLLFTIKHQGFSPARASVSPNGQFIAVVLNDYLEQPVNDPNKPFTSTGSNRVIVYDNGGQEIAVLRQGKNMLMPPVWSEDSRTVYFSEISYTSPIGLPDSTLTWYNVETNITGQQVASLTPDAPNRPMQPLEVHANRLFALAQAIGSEDPGTIYSLSLMPDGTPTGESKKLLDLTISNRGYDILEDGSAIIIAKGGLEELGGSEKGPYTLEMMDVFSGKMTTMRTSATEKFTTPIFFGGQQFLYGTQDGIFRLTTPDQKVYPIYSEKSPNAVVGDEFRPISVRPDGGRVVFMVSGPMQANQGFYTTAIEENVSTEVSYITVALDPYYVLWGWTESLDRPF